MHHEDEFNSLMPDYSAVLIHKNNCSILSSELCQFSRLSSLQRIFPRAPSLLRISPQVSPRYCISSQPLSPAYLSSSLPSLLHILTPPLSGISILKSPLTIAYPHTPSLLHIYPQVSPRYCISSHPLSPAYLSSSLLSLLHILTSPSLLHIYPQVSSRYCISSYPPLACISILKSPLTIAYPNILLSPAYLSSSLPSLLHILTPRSLLHISPQVSPHYCISSLPPFSCISILKSPLAIAYPHFPLSPAYLSPSLPSLLHILTSPSLLHIYPQVSSRYCISSHPHLSCISILKFLLAIAYLHIPLSPAYLSILMSPLAIAYPHIPPCSLLHICHPGPALTSQHIYYLSSCPHFTAYLSSRPAIPSQHIYYPAPALTSQHIYHNTLSLLFIYPHTNISPTHPLMNLSLLHICPQAPPCISILTRHSLLLIYPHIPSFLHNYPYSPLAYLFMYPKPSALLHIYPHVPSLLHIILSSRALSSSNLSSCPTLSCISIFKFPLSCKSILTSSFSRINTLSVPLSCISIHMSSPAYPSSRPPPLLHISPHPFLSPAYISSCPIFPKYLSHAPSLLLILSNMSLYPYSCPHLSN